jgi:hypothetical protein
VSGIRRFRRIDEMPLPLPVLAFDLRFAIFLAFIAISIISWIMNQVKANQRPQPAPRRPQQPAAPRPRNDRIQTEIDQFLKEAAGRRGPPKRGEVLDVDDIEIVSSPSASRRPPPRRAPPAARPTAPAPVPVPVAHRPGEELAGRQLTSATPFAQHPARARMDERMAAQTALHLPHSVDLSVSKHLGVFAAESPTSTGSLAHAGTRISTRSQAAVLLTALRTPVGVQQAVMMQEILQKPRALRR